MKTRNILIAAAVSLLMASSVFVLAGADDTGGGSGGYPSDDILARGMLSPGDYIVWEITYTHLDVMTSFENRLEVMAVDQDTGDVTYSAHCGLSDMVCQTTVFGFKELIHAPLRALSDTDETDVIDTPFGPRECTKHVREEGTATQYWADVRTGIVYKEVEETNDHVSV